MTARKQAPAQEPKTAPEAVTLNIYQKLHLAKQSMGKVIKNATNPKGPKRDQHEPLQFLDIEK